MKVIQDLSSARTLDQVMFFVRTAARDIAEADGATFVLKDREFCFYADEDAITPLWKGQRFPLTACISGWSMLHKEAVIIEDIYLDSRIPIDAYRPTFVKSLTMTPIRKHDPIGAIGTYWKEKHTPTDEQLEMLQALADTVSVALENVQMYESLQVRIEDLKKTNQAKDEFLFNLSHELRTPLNAVLGWSEIMSDEHATADDRDTGIKTIRESVKAQTHIIDDLLDITKISSDRFSLEYLPVDLLHIAEEAIHECEPEAQRKNIHISLDTRLESAKVLGDEYRLKQIFKNILSNSLKFSKADSEVLIQMDRRGPHVQVQVMDQGIGMDAEFLPHIFENYKQADSSMTRKYGGLGLGLAITSHLVHAHKGQITAASEGPGQGSTMTFTIPLLEAQSVEVPGRYIPEERLIKNRAEGNLDSPFH